MRTAGCLIICTLSVNASAIAQDDGVAYLAGPKTAEDTQPRQHPDRTWAAVGRGSN
jgi:hypothetical protein